MLQFLASFQRSGCGLRIICPILVSAICCLPRVQAQPVDSLLQKKIEHRIAGFQGDVGVFVHHLKSGTTAGVNVDSVFPTASMIKIPILVTLFDRIERGELQIDEKLVYRDSLLYPGGDILGSFQDGEEIALDKVALLMATMSDNTASLWLQEIAGTGTAINDWLADNDFDHTRMNSRTPGRSDDWEKYGWGQTTPREIARLLTLIRTGDAVSAGASEEMYRILTRSYWDDEALSQIPPSIQAASKQGAVSRSKSEVVLVNAPSGDYVFCVITNNQKDDRWAPDNEGYRLIRSISEMLWQHFEPQHRWRPAAR